MIDFSITTDARRACEGDVFELPTFRGYELNSALE
jgi:hypothetical protein